MWSPPPHFFFLPLAPAAPLPGFLRTAFAPAAFFFTGFLLAAPAFCFLVLPAGPAPSSSSLPLACVPPCAGAKFS